MGNEQGLKRMKAKLYSKVSIEQRGEGFQVLLDGRSIKTWGLKPLITRKDMAHVLAKEWTLQVDGINKKSMPFMRLLSVCVDKVSLERDTFIQSLVSYAKTDCLCYLSPTPRNLYEEQQKHWLPWLEWMGQKWGINFVPTTSLIGVTQSDEALEKVEQLLEGYNDYYLTALVELTSALDSLVLSLAVVEKALEVKQAYELSQLEFEVQERRWGQDEETLGVRKQRYACCVQAFTFLKLNTPNL